MVAVLDIQADPVPPAAPYADGTAPYPLPVARPVAPTQDVVATGSGYGAYVAAYANWAHALPHPGDDLQRDFGMGIYTTMALDPQIRSSLRVLVTGANNQPPVLAANAPVGSAQADLGTTIAAFCRENLRRLPRPLTEILVEMATTALTHGHNLAEQLYRVDTLDPAVGPQLLLADLKPKPLTATAFVQDAYGNDLGVFAQRPGRPLVAPPVVIGGTLNDTYPLYPMSKFAVLTWDKLYGDPRGRSALRPLYAAWWQKQQTWPELLAYLARFGQPSVVIEMAPGASDQTDPVTNVVTRAADVYLAQGQAFQAGGVLVLPAGAKALLLEAKGTGAAIIAAIHLFDNQLIKGLLAQSLANSEGAHASRAQASVHQDILGLVLRQLKSWLAHFVRHQILTPLVRYNYGDAAVALVPEVSLGQTDPENLAALLQAYSQLALAHFWDPTVVPPDVGRELDARAGMPERQMVVVGPDGVGGGPEDIAPADAGGAPTGAV